MRAPSPVDDMLTAEESSDDEYNPEVEDTEEEEEDEEDESEDKREEEVIMEDKPTDEMESMLEFMNHVTFSVDMFIMHALWGYSEAMLVVV